MNVTKDGGPAFPVQTTHTWYKGGLVEVHELGMSLRDWFAGQALSGMLSESGRYDAAGAALDAYIFADAMLRARERGQEGANDDAWALDAAVTIHPAVGPESIHPTTWTARYWDGVRTLEESAPTIAAALSALRAKVEGGAQ